MDKKQLIEYINGRLRGNLNSFNTSYSNINKSKAVWWFNIPVQKFSDDVHLLLNQTSRAIWIKLPRGFVLNLHATFKVRADKNAVDLEISADRSYKYLVDVKSGGTQFEFKGFIEEQILY